MQNIQLVGNREPLLGGILNSAQRHSLVLIKGNAAPVRHLSTAESAVIERRPCSINKNTNSRQSGTERVTRSRDRQLFGHSVYGRPVLGRQLPLSYPAAQPL